MIIIGNLITRIKKAFSFKEKTETINTSKEDKLINKIANCIPKMEYISLRAIYMTLGNILPHNEQENDYLVYNYRLFDFDKMMDKYNKQKRKIEKIKTINSEHSLNLINIEDIITIKEIEDKMIEELKWIFIIKNNHIESLEDDKKAYLLDVMIGCYNTMNNKQMVCKKCYNEYETKFKTEEYCHDCIMKDISLLPF